MVRGALHLRVMVACTLLYREALVPQTAVVAVVAHETLRLVAHAVVMVVLAAAVVVRAQLRLVEGVKAVSAAVVEVPMILAVLHPKVALEVTVAAADLVVPPTAQAATQLF
jgi:hypothetical protein